MSSSTKTSVTALTHLDETGAAHMVHVGDKPVTARTASASARLTMSAAAAAALFNQTLAKGDAIATARIAGIQATKRTAELIPLCHPLPLTHVSIIFAQVDNTLHITCTCATDGKTGVEMEALTGASVAALTIYDMLKSIDRTLTFDVRLEHKTGGSRGDYARSTPEPETP
jgi:cyclic pyranopterin monophosphate synthase